METAESAQSESKVTTQINESDVKIIPNENEEIDFENGIIQATPGIVDIEKDVGKEEHMLPIHFLPEGRKAYDWIKRDLKNDDAQRETEERKTRYRTLSKEEDKPPEISKGRATTVNSVVYHNARFGDGGGLSPANEKQLVQSLLSAAELGDIDRVKEILSKSPLIINRTDSDGYTALHRACYSGHESMVLLLIERGGNINSSTDDGWQPLHCAVRWSFLNICQHLVSKRANVNALTNGRQTPLHLAALTIENKNILEFLLLQPEIDANIRNAAGDTACDIALRSGIQHKLFEMVDEGLRI